MLDENTLNESLRNTRRVIILIVGVTIILFGIALIFLPGPGLLIIVAGLAFLSSEYLWAKKALQKVKDEFRETKALITKFI